MRTLWHDLVFALRLARRNRGFTAVALLSLALGIAANTLLFTLVYAVLLDHCHTNSRIACCG